MHVYLCLPENRGGIVEVDRNGSVQEILTAAQKDLHVKLRARDWWFECGGRVLSQNAKLSELGASRTPTIHARCRLLGGGGDGGSTGAESRDCYLEMYKEKKAAKVDPSEEKLAKWTRCQLSGEPLSPPCVCDQLGSLFNKDAALSVLISKSLPDSLKHIRKSKDLVDLQLTASPSSKRNSTDAANDKNYQLSSESSFSCPVSGLDFNGSFRFFAHRKTGHVVSERGIKEAPQAVKDVIGCEDCGPEQWIPLNGTAEEVKELRDQIIKQRGLLKKDKKRKLAAKNSEEAVKKAPRLSAAEFTPELASKKVYKSLFLSSQEEQKETFLCRSTAARGMNLT